MKYGEIQGRRERSFHWAQMLRTKLMESSFSVRTSDFSGSASSLLELTRAETSLTLYFTILGMTKIWKLSLLLGFSSHLSVKPFISTTVYFDVV